MNNMALATKKNISIRIEENQLKWLDEKVRRSEFASRAHGIRYCIQHVMDESEPYGIIYHSAEEVTEK